MDFAFSPDQQAFADSARALFADACTDEALRAHDAGQAPYMRSLWAQCVAMGLHAMTLGEAHGGLGLGLTDLAAVLQEQGAALAQVPLAEHQLAASALERFAPELAAHELGAAAVGENLLALAAGGAAQGHGVQARLQGGELLLHGQADAVALAGQSHATLLAVKLEGAVRLAWLPRATAGLVMLPGRTQHHLAVATLQLDGVRLSAQALLQPQAMAWLEPRYLAALAALQMGVSARQLARTVEYVSQRKQFGRVIGTFQLVAGQLADAQIALEALRSAQAQLLYRLDAGLGCQAQALAVRTLAAQAGHLIGHKAQHVHGGMGVDVTYPIHRHLYWSRWLSQCMGGAEATLQRLGDWLAEHDELGWKYDLPEDLGAAHAH